MEPLQQALENLQTHRQRVEASGPTAPVGVWLEVYCPGGRDAYYARLKADRPMWGRARSRGLQRAGSANHRDWQNRIKRRDALLEIDRRSQAIQAMLDDPIWLPD